MNQNEIIFPCRLSYCRLFEPESVNGGDPKYSVCCIIPKDDKATLARINKKIEEAKQTGATKKWGGKVPKNLKLPLRDGDTEREDQEEFNGTVFLNASSTRQPKVIDRTCQPIMDADEVYSGCYANAKISLYAFDSNGNRGVACGLVAVQKVKDGERLGGSDTGADGFETLDESSLDAEIDTDLPDWLK